MRAMTVEYVNKAEEDLVIARAGASLPKPVHDPVCFHCQQCAEKYLKALLQEAGLPVPHTHNLSDLRELILPHHAEVRPLRRGLDMLTRFAVLPRYPMFDASKRQAQAALRWAVRVRAVCRPLLGLRP